MGLIARGDIGRIIAGKRGVADHGRVAAVAIGAAELDRGADVHRRRIGLHVAGDAARGLALGQFVALALRGRRGLGIDAVDRLFLVAGEGRAAGAEQQGHGENQNREEEAGKTKGSAHQKLRIALPSTE
jgi:hypothetical protein